MVTLLSVIEVRSPWCRVLLGGNEAREPQGRRRDRGQWAGPERETVARGVEHQAWTGGVVERAGWGSVCPVQPCRHPAQGNDLVPGDGPLAIRVSWAMDEYARMVSMAGTVSNGPLPMPATQQIAPSLSLPRAACWWGAVEHLDACGQQACASSQCLAASRPQAPVLPSSPRD
jgi:hypothetical protein